MTLTIHTMLAAALVFGGVALGTGPLISLLRRFQVLDYPNERSSHQRPTPVGGGVLIIATLVPAWLWLEGAAFLPLALAALGLAGLSLVDDFRRVPTGLRFICHIIAVAGVLYLNPGLAGWLPDAIPGPVALVGIGLGWVWFINLFNFMDGIDGISGVECLGIGLGVAVITALDGVPSGHGAGRHPACLLSGRCDDHAAAAAVAGRRPLAGSPGPFLPAGHPGRAQSRPCGLPDFGAQCRADRPGRACSLAGDLARPGRRRHHHGLFIDPVPPARQRGQPLRFRTVMVKAGSKSFTPDRAGRRRHHKQWI